MKYVQARTKAHILPSIAIEVCAALSVSKAGLRSTLLALKCGAGARGNDNIRLFVINPNPPKISSDWAINIRYSTRGNEVVSLIE
jgi:hypothetical protein